MISNDEFYDLLDRYAEGRCSEAESAVVENWYLNFNEGAGRVIIPERVLLEVQYRLKAKIIREKPKTAFLSTYRYLAAASVLAFILSIGIVVFKAGQRPPNQAVTEKLIKPGSDKAILTLADGKSINLTLASTEISKKNNKVIGQVKSGEIILNGTAGSQEEGKAEQLNTLAVPRGGKWKMVLADGTRVWLNAATDFRFPTAFKANSREVFLDGEAYFEVAKDSAHPFIVHSGSQSIEVLGTHFNINSYADEKSVQTTLLEGSVKINGNIILKPGQKAVSDRNKTLVSEADVEDAIAWKNGAFIFDNTPLSSIMRQIGRWYNVDVQFQTASLEDITFSGSAQRAVPLLTLLKRLSLTKEVDFSINGNKIIVKPYQKK